MKKIKFKFIRRLALITLSFVLMAMPVLATSHTTWGKVVGADTTCRFKLYIISEPARVSPGAALVSMGSPASIIWTLNAGNPLVNFDSSADLNKDSAAIVWRLSNAGLIGHKGYYAVMNEQLSLVSPQQFLDSTLREIPVPTATVKPAEGRVDVSWPAELRIPDTSRNPDLINGNLISYRIWRGTDGINFGGAPIGTVDNPGSGTVTFQDTTGDTNTTYYYAIELVFRGNVVAGDSTQAAPILSSNSNSVVYPEKQAILNVAPASLTFTAATGGSNPADQTLTVRNSGGQSLTWSAAVSGSWLSIVDNTSGGNGPTTVTVHADIAGKPVGNYNGSITFTRTDANPSGQSPIIIPVTLNIISVDHITVSPTTTTLYDGQQQSFTAQAFYTDTSTNTVTATATFAKADPGAPGDVTGNIYKAPDTITQDATVEIIASYTYGGTTKTATAAVSLVRKALESITISPNGIVLPHGGQQQFTVTANYNNDRHGTVASDDPNLTWVASVGTINQGLLDSTQAGNGTVTATYRFYDRQRSFSVNILLWYANMFLRVENGRVNVYAHDTQGNVFAVNSYDSISYGCTGGSDGNRVALDGTLTEGTKEGPYAVSATVVIAGNNYTPTGTWDINKGAPVPRVMIGTNQVVNDSIISNTPSFSIDVTDGNGVNAVQLYLDGTEITAPALRITANDAASTSVTAAYAVTTPLAAGTHYLRVVTRDKLGNEGTVDITGLKIYDALSVQGTPMNYPNPFKPGSGQGTTIRYILTQAADIKLMIYDLSGRVVYTKFYPADPLGTSQGGRAGQNDPTWDGKDFNGKLVPNGVYTCFITSANKSLGSVKISVYD